MCRTVYITETQDRCHCPSICPGFSSVSVNTPLVRYQLLALVRRNRNIMVSEFVTVNCHYIFLLCVQHENVVCSFAKEIHFIIVYIYSKYNCSKGHSIIQTSDFILVGKAWIGTSSQVSQAKKVDSRWEKNLCTCIRLDYACKEICSFYLNSLQAKSSATTPTWNQRFTSPLFILTNFYVYHYLLLWVSSVLPWQPMHYGYCSYLLLKFCCFCKE